MTNTVVAENTQLDPITVDTQAPGFTAIDSLCKWSVNPSLSELPKLALEFKDNLSPKIHVKLTLFAGQTPIINRNFFIDFAGKRIVDEGGSPITVAGISIDSEGYISFSFQPEDFLQFLRTPGELNVRCVVSDEAGNVVDLSKYKFQVPDWQKLVQNELRKIVANNFGNGNRIVYINDGFAFGDEWKKFGEWCGTMGVEFKEIKIEPEKIWKNPRDQINYLKTEIDKYVQAKDKKAILIGWGVGGLIAMHYLKQYGDSGQIGKFITISIPMEGFNTFSQLGSVLSLGMCVSPIVTFVQNSGILDGVLNAAKQVNVDINLMGFMQNLLRNDALVNPMDLVSLVSGRMDFKLEVQGFCDFLNEIKGFNPEVKGVPVESITTMIWPQDMGPAISTAIHAAGSLVFGGLGFAGIYEQIPAPVWKMDVKMYNNFEEELGKMIADAVIKEFDKQVVDKLWVESEKQLNKLADTIDFSSIRRAIEAEIDRATAIAGGYSPLYMMATYLSNHKPEILSNSVYYTRVLTNYLAQNGVEDVVGFLRHQTNNIRCITNTISTYFSNYVIAPNDMFDAAVAPLEYYVSLDFVRDYAYSLVPSDVRKYLKKEDLDQYVINPVIDYVYSNTFGMNVSVWYTNEYHKFQTAKYGVISTARGIVNTVNDTGTYVSTNMAFVADTIDSLMASAPGMVSNVTEEQVDRMIASLYDMDNLMKGELAKVIQQTIDASGVMTNETIVMMQEALGYLENIDSIKKKPIGMLKNTYYGLATELKKSMREEIIKRTAEVIPDDLNKTLANLKIEVKIPGGWVGLGIMAAVGFVGLEYLRNTDLISENEPLLISKLMGGKGSQGNIPWDTKKIQGMFFAGPQNPEVLVDRVVGKPTIYLSSIDGIPPRNLAIEEGYYPPSDFRYIDEQSQTKTAGLIKTGNFVNRVEGLINDTLAATITASYSVNFDTVKDIHIKEDGVFSIEMPPMLEGDNTVIIDAYNIKGERTRSVFTIRLDMMPMQIYAVYPQYNEAIGSLAKPITAGIYDNSASGLNTNGIEVYLKAMPSVNNTFATIAAITNTSWQRISNFTIAENKQISFTPTNTLVDGEYAVRVKSTDAVGNKSESSWAFFVDKTAPVCSITNNGGNVFCTTGDYSRRIYLRYGDNMSGILYNVNVSLAARNGAAVRTIKSYTARPIGFESFELELPGVSDGNYDILVSMNDAAGNHADIRYPISIDNTKPSVALAANVPSLINRTNLNLSFDHIVSEDCGVLYRFDNLTKEDVYIQASKSYYAPLVFSGDAFKYVDMINSGTITLSNTGTQGTNVYYWDFLNPVTALRDGMYKLTMYARDDAGNKSADFTQTDIRVDRTAPVVYQVFALPMVISSARARNAVLTFRVNESQDDAVNKSDVLPANISVIDKRSRSLVAVLTNMNASIVDENRVEWNGMYTVGPKAGTDCPQGEYLFKVDVTDCHGNTSTRFADVVKDGVSPMITYPVDGDILHATVAVRGKALDPVWDNKLEFKQYALYLSTGSNAMPVDLKVLDTGVWKTNGIMVPLINRTNGDIVNVSLRPIEDSILTYLDTTALSDGTYTLLLVSEEKDEVLLEANLGGSGVPAVGRAAGTTVVFAVSNTEPLYVAPYIGLGFDIAKTNIVNTLTAKDSLSIRYTLDLTNISSVDVNVDVFSSNNTHVFHHFFPSVTGGQIDNAPSFSIDDIGYYIWQDVMGYHLRMVSGDTNRLFYGTLKTDGKLVVISNVFTRGQAEGINAKDTHSLSFMASVKHETNGIDFTTDGDAIEFELYYNDRDAAHPVTYLGSAKTHPVSNTFSMNRIKPIESVLWDGKDTYGSYADDGTYRLEITASGTGREGYAAIKTNIGVRSTFGFITAEVPLKQMAVIGGNGTYTNTITVSFALSRAAYADVVILDETNGLVCTLVSNRFTYGNVVNSMLWAGNYPYPQSTQVKIAGNYKVAIAARAASGNDVTTKTIEGISIITPSAGDLFAELKKIGTGTNTNTLDRYNGLDVVDGISDYYFKAKAQGNYYPPIPFDYRVNATGKQAWVQYPFVPFISEERAHPQRMQFKIVYSIEAKWFNESKRGFDWYWSESVYKTTDIVKSNVKYFTTDDNGLIDIPVSFSGPGGDWSDKVCLESVRIYGTIYTPNGTQLLPFDKIAIQSQIQSDDNNDKFRERGIFYAPYFSDGVFSYGFFGNIPSRSIADKDRNQSVSASIRIKINNWNETKWGNNNIANRFTAWCSENKYYYGTGSSNAGAQGGDINAGTSASGVDGQTPNVRSESNDYMIVHGNGILTNKGKDGYISFFYKQSHNFSADPPNQYARFPQMYYSENVLVNNQLSFDQYPDGYWTALTNITPNFITNVNEVMTVVGTNTNVVTNIGGFPDFMTNIVTNEDAIWTNVYVTNVLSNYITNIVRDSYITNETLNALNNNYFETVGGDTWHYQAGTKKYLLHEMQNKMKPFPSSGDDIAAWNGIGSNGEYYPKYDSTVEALIHPDYSFINQGGYSNSYITNHAVIRYDYSAHCYLFEVNDHGKFSFTTYVSNNGISAADYARLKIALLTKTNFSIVTNDGVECIAFKNITFTNFIMEAIGRNDIAFVDTRASDLCEHALANVTGSRAWSTMDDPYLSNGYVTSAALKFNEYAFDPDGIADNALYIREHYPKELLSTNDTNKYKKALFWGSNSIDDAAFCERNPYVSSNTINDNPYIDLTKWNVKLYYLNGDENNDLEVRIMTNNAGQTTMPTGNIGEKDAHFFVKLKPNATPKKIVPITGSVNGLYSLYYFNGKKWDAICENKIVPNTNEQVLCFWDATRLYGLYTVLLKVTDASNNMVMSTREVMVGSLVKQGTNTFTNTTVVESPYKRSGIAFGTNAFGSDTVVSVNEVSLTNVSVVNRPDITPLGPVVEFRPSGADFAEGNRPTFSMYFTREEAVTLNMLDGNLALYNLKEDGTLERVENSVTSFYGINDIGQTIALGNNYPVIRDSFLNMTTYPQAYLNFTASVSHFSYYTVLNAASVPMPPVIDKLPDTVNFRDINISGSGDKNLTVIAYVDDDPILNDSNDTTPPIVQSNICLITNALATNNLRGTFRIDGIHLPYDGTNYIHVTYRDVKNRTVATTSIICDTVAPLFTYFNIPSYSVSPNGDGVQDSLSVTFAVDEKAAVKFKVYDMAGNEVYFRSLDVAKNATTTLTYDCIGATGKLDDGIYDARVYVADASGNVSETSDKRFTFTVDTTMPSIAAFKLSSTNASPNGDGKYDSITASYNASEDIVATAFILDGTNKIYNQYTNRTISKGSQTHSINLIYNNRTLMDKDYRFYIEYKDLAGNGGVSAGALFGIDTLAPLVYDLSLSSEEFTSDSGMTTVSARLDENASVWLAIFDAASNRIASFPATNVTAGRISLDFNGRVDSKPLLAGTYYLAIGSEDLFGNKGESERSTFRIVSDTIKPDIDIISVIPNAISPTNAYSIAKHDVSTITFVLSDNVNGNLKDVNVRLFNADGMEVRTLMSNLVRPQGTNTLLWDGRNDNGAYVPDGYYRVLISAKDNYGNQAMVKTADILVDNGNPAIIRSSLNTRGVSPLMTSGTDKFVLDYSLWDVYSSQFYVRHLVYDSKNRIIRELYQNAAYTNYGRWYDVVGNTNTVEWNCTDIFGVTVPEGYYTFVFEMYDQAFNTVPKAKQNVMVYNNVMVDNTAPVVSICSISNQMFSPNPPDGDGVADWAIIDYSLSDNLDTQFRVEAYIKNSNNIIVYTNTYTNRGIGTNRFIWNGRGNMTFNNNVLSPDGAYQVVLNAYDTAANCSTNVTVNVMLDITPPKGFALHTCVPGMLSPSNTDGIYDSNAISYIVASNTTGDDEVYVSHKITGDVKNIDWEAVGEGTLYPPSTNDIAVIAQGYKKHYQQTPISFTIEGGYIKTPVYPTQNVTFDVTNNGSETYLVWVDGYYYDTRIEYHKQYEFWGWHDSNPPYRTNAAPPAGYSIYSVGDWSGWGTDFWEGIFRCHERSRVLYYRQYTSTYSQVSASSFPSTNTRIISSLRADNPTTVSPLNPVPWTPGRTSQSVSHSIAYNGESIEAYVSTNINLYSYDLRAKSYKVENVTSGYDITDAAGFYAEIFNTQNFSGLIHATNISTLNESWGSGTPHNSVRADNFSVQYTGYIIPETDGTYRFSRSIVQNGTLAISLGTTVMFSSGSESITTNLKAGVWYPVKVQYSHTTGNAGFTLQWKKDAGAYVAVPASVQRCGRRTSVQAVLNSKSYTMIGKLCDYVTMPSGIVGNDLLPDSHMVYFTNFNVSDVVILFSNSINNKPTQQAIGNSYYKKYSIILADFSNYYIYAKLPIDTAISNSEYAVTNNSQTVVVSGLTPTVKQVSIEPNIEKHASTDFVEVHITNFTVQLTGGTPERIVHQMTNNVGFDETAVASAGTLGYFYPLTGSGAYYHTVIPAAIDLTNIYREPYTTPVMSKTNDVAEVSLTSTGKLRNTFRDSGYTYPASIADYIVISNWKIRTYDYPLHTLNTNDIVISDIVNDKIAEESGGMKRNGDFMMQLSAASTYIAFETNVVRTENDSNKVVWTGTNTFGIPVADGYCFSRVSAVDKAGNSALSIRNILVDNTPPVISITAPLSNSIVSGNIDFAGTIADRNLAGYTVKLRLESGTDTNLIASGRINVVSNTITRYDSTGLSNRYVAIFEAYDVASNRTTVEIPIDVRNDPAYVLKLDPASSTVLSPNSDGILDTAAIMYTLSEMNTTVSVEVYSGGSLVKTFSSVVQNAGTFQLVWDGKNNAGVVCPDGNYRFVVTASAIVGGTPHIVQKEMNVRLDTTVPAISMSTPVSNQFMSMRVCPLITIADDSAVTYTVSFCTSNNTVIDQVSGSGFKLSNIEAGRFLVEGLNGMYVVKVTAHDDASNENTVNVPVNIDNIMPGLDIISPANNAYVRQALTVTGIANDTFFKEYRVTLRNMSGGVKYQNTFTTPVVMNNTLATIDTTPYPDGAYAIDIGIYDNAGNTTWGTRQITIDNTVPLFAINGLTNRVHGGSVSITGTSGDNFKVQSVTMWYKRLGDAAYERIGSIAGATNTLAIDYTWNTPTNIVSGTYLILVEVADGAGNMQSGEYQITIDKSSPLVAINDPDATAGITYVSNTITPRITVIDDNIVSVGMKLISGTSVIPLNIVSNTLYTNSVFGTFDLSMYYGETRLLLEAIDASGNKSTAIATIFIDTVAPVVSLDTPENYSVRARIFDVTGTITDDRFGHFAVYVINSSNGITNLPVLNYPNLEKRTERLCTVDTATMVDGEYIIRVAVYDLFSNRNSIDRMISIDNTPPVIAIQSPSSNSICSSNLQIRSTYTEQHPSIFRMSIDGTNIAVKTYFDSVTGNFDVVLDTKTVTDGMHIITMNALDAVSNSSECRVPVVIDNTAPALTSFTISPNRFNVTSTNRIMPRFSADAGERGEMFVDIYLGTNPVTSFSSADYDTNVFGYWNGTDSNGVPMALGSYTAVCRFKDTAGNMSSNAITNTFTVVNDDISPVIVLTSLNTNYVSPNGDGRNDILTATYSITDNVSEPLSYVMISVRETNAAADILLSVMTNVAQGAFTYTGSLTNVPDGYYLLIMRVIDNNLNFAAHVTNIVVKATLPSVSVFTETATMISPNGDGFFDTNRIAYAVIDSAIASTTFELALVKQSARYVVASGTTNGSFNGVVSTASLALPDGIYTPMFSISDRAGNRVITNLNPFIIDTVVPQVYFALSGGAYFTNSNAYVSLNAHISIEGNDGSNGTGIHDISCAMSGGAYTGIPFQFTNTFGLTGTNGEAFTILYAACDMVSNSTPLYSNAIILDTAIPASQFSNHVPFMVYNGVYYANNNDAFTFNAFDTVSGIQSIEYYITTNNIDITNIDYVSIIPRIYSNEVIRFADFGNYHVYFRAIDNVGNAESWHEFALSTPYPDRTPPATTLQTIISPVTVNSTNYNPLAGWFYFTATDPLGTNDGTATGVAYTRYQIDNSVWLIYTNEQFTLPEGLHTIRYYSEDKIPNYEAMNVYTIAIDATKPITTALLVSGNVTNAANATNRIGYGAQLVLNAIDPLNAGVSSGVKSVEYRMQGESQWRAYTTPVVLDAMHDGMSVIEYRAIDNVMNTGETKTVAFVKDAIPPSVSILSPVDKDIVNCNTPVYAKITDANIASYTLTLTPINGGASLLIASNSMATNGRIGVINISAVTNGNYRLTLAATDVFGNSNSTSIALRIGMPKHVLTYGNERRHHWWHERLGSWCNDRQMTDFIPYDKLRMQSPWDLNVSINDFACVADKDAGIIRVLDGIGNQIYAIHADAHYLLKDWFEHFTHPKDIVFASSGDFYIVDSGRDRILKFRHDGQFAGIIGDKVLKDPANVAVDANDNVYVADRGNGKVVKFATNGTVAATLGGFKNPEGVIIANGFLYIADTGNNAVKRCGLDLSNMTTLGLGPLNAPHNITVDGFGQLVVAEKNRVMKYDVYLNKILAFSNNTRTNTYGRYNAFSDPQGMTFDRGG
ncbi:MAG: Ig-like domain repeat protein, partial [Candidatus Omnitrophica bacterium]|nr:Ig-like domain repeat protein [Candidatus Omnitrophota bacterium]